MFSQEHMINITKTNEDLDKVTSSGKPNYDETSSLETTCDYSKLEKKVEPNYKGVAACIVLMGLLNMPSSARETLGTVWAQDLYAFSPTEATTKVAFMVGSSVIPPTITTLLLLKFVKNTDSRKILIGFGLIVIVVSYGLRYPMSNQPISLPNCTYSVGSKFDSLSHLSSNKTVASASDNILSKLGNIKHQNSNSSCTPYGCPYVAQPWCLHTKLITQAQISILYTVSRMGLGIAIPSLQSVFSKIFGPVEMGVWMSLMFISASVSKILNPLWLSYVWVLHGPVVVSMGMFSLELLGLVITLVFYKSMAPMELNNNFEDSEKEKLNKQDE